MSRDHHDALIDQLLRESLGGDRPRDLTPRVMAMARAHDRTRRSWWISAGAALAASLVIAASLFVLWNPYPAPVVSGAISLVNGGDTIQRGAQLTTGFDEGGSVSIGGYVVLTVSPNTTFTLGGEKKKEVVYLDQGTLAAAVTQKKGTFDIVVDEAVVHVTGTKFDVDVSTVLNEEEAQLQKKLRVVVTEGSVEVDLKEKREKKLIRAGESVEVTISSKSVLGPRVQEAAGDAAAEAQALIRDFQPAEPEEEPATAPGVETAAAPPEPEVSIATRPLEPSVNGVESRPAAANRAAGAATRGATTRGARGNNETGTGRGNAGPAQRPQPNRGDAKFVPLTVIVGQGPFEFDGIFQKVGAYYVLRTERAFLLLGTGDDIPKNAPNPGPNSRVHVRFAKGKVLSIISKSAPTPATPGRGRDGSDPKSR